MHSLAASGACPARPTVHSLALTLTLSERSHHTSRRRFDAPQPAAHVPQAPAIHL